MGVRKVHLLPPQVHDLSRPHPVAIGQQDHQRVAAAMAVALGHFDQLVDLCLGEMLPGAQLSIWPPARRRLFDYAILVACDTSASCGLAMVFAPSRLSTVQ
jgi:hypothetical protein